MYVESEGQSGQLAALMSQFSGLSALTGISVSGGGNERSQALAVLTSRQLAHDFAVKQSLLPELFSAQWNGQTQQWRGTPPSEWQIGDRVLKSVVRVSTDPKTELTTVTATWHEPEGAARIANDYIAFANERLRESAVRENEAALSFLENELSIAKTVELREAAARLSEARLKSLMLARVAQNFAFRVIDRAVAPPPGMPSRPSSVIAVLLAAGMAIVAWSLLVFASSAWASLRGPH